MPPHTAIQVEDFAALYEELAALVRARVPLEPGLVRLARDLPRRPAELTESVSRQLAAGQSLEQALDDPKLRAPSVFRAALRAGVRSGRLAEALEGVALAARRMTELRRAVGLSLIYPTIIVCVGLLQIPLLADVLSTMVAWMRDSHQDIPAWMGFFEGWSERRIGWWLSIPAVIALIALLWSAVSGAGIVGGGWRTALFRCLPWVRPAIDNARRAHFSDQLALLVENGVPLGESLRLAAEATVDPRLKSDALAGAAAIEAGRPLAEICAVEGALTPMLRWLMGSASANQSLGRSMRHAAETYQRRAVANADLAKICLPSLLTAVVGGGVTASMILLVVYPWTQLLQQIVK
jgi:type II secretory pathway component PulF